MRLYVVSLGVFFLRVAVPMWVALLGPIGMDFTTFTGPALAFWAYGCYLVPLAMMELYLRDAGEAGFGAAVGDGWRGVRDDAVDGRGYGRGRCRDVGADDRENVTAGRLPISEVMNAKIAAKGIDAAVAQYRGAKGDRAGKL